MTVEETYNKYPAGTLFESDTRDYFVKPKDDILIPPGMLVDIFSGEIFHYSKFKKLTPRYGHEIMW